MNDKERLEKIKEIDISPLCFYLNEMTNFDGKLLKGYWKWLIKQTERVEELEKEKDEWKDTAQSYYMTNQELREQNKRYRKAINNIIEKAMLFGTNEEVYDAIQDAIKALEGDN